MLQNKDKSVRLKDLDITVALTLNEILNNNILTILCKIIFIVRIVSLKVLMNKFSFYYVELNFEHMRTAGKYQSLGTQRW